MQDITGNRKTVYPGNGDKCYRKNFAGNEPPVGLRDPMNLEIRYICQKDYQEYDDGTHYGTMFDKQFRIPVYSAYTLTKDKVNFKEWTRPNGDKPKVFIQASNSKLILLQRTCLS